MQTCVSCGKQNPVGFTFCGHCGARIDPGSSPSQIQSLTQSPAKSEKVLQALRSRMPAPLSKKITGIDLKLEGQRREVTVMFVDIVNFSETSQILGAEETYLIVNELMGLLVDVVFKYEGTIDKFTGDGLMALFGLPVNHENDTERAVRTALEMLEVFEPFKRRWRFEKNVEIDVRIGINTGHVIAGKLGSQSHMEYTVIGDTVNLASRLEGQARPGSVLVSSRTFHRTSPIFEFESFIIANIKGFDKPIKAFRPLGIRKEPGFVRGLPGMRAPMIGRKKSLDKVWEAFQKMVDSQSSQFVLVSGEAGLGKSRLINEFRHQVYSNEVTVFQGTCASFMRVTPYRVIADLVRNILQLSDLESPEIQRITLVNYLDGLNVEKRDILPFLLHVLGLPQMDPTVQTRITLLNPDMLQRQIHSSLRTLLIAESKRSPTVYIFEDLHWVDFASGEFFEYFIKSIHDVPLLIIIISRLIDPKIIPENTLTLLRDQERVVEISLRPLSNKDARGLLDNLISENTPELSNLKDAIMKRAVGNPYYMEELLRILIEQDGLLLENETWSATPLAAEIIREVPGTLQDIIVARFDRLSYSQRELLQKAAVLGDTFGFDLLKTLIEPTTTPILDELEALEERVFLIKAKKENQEVFSFKHSMIQDIIYNTILKRDLLKFHSQIAQVVKDGSFWLPVNKNEMLAYHYSNSNQPEKSIPHLILAAEKASRQYANASAEEHYRMAITLMNKYAGALFDPIDYARVRIGLGKVLKYQGNFEEAADYIGKATAYLKQELLDQIEDRQKSALLIVKGFHELADIRVREGALDLAGDMLQEALDLLKSEGFKEFSHDWRQIIDRMAWVYFRQGRLDDAHELAERAISNFDIEKTNDLIALATLHNTLGGINWQRANMEDAISHVDQSLGIYQELNYPWGIAIALTNLGILHSSQGNWKKAVSYFRQADILRNRHGYLPERPTNLKNLGEVLILLGDLDQARQSFLKSKEISMQLGMSHLEAYAEIGLCRLAIIELNYSQAEKSLNHVKSLLGEEQPDDLSIQMLFLEALIIAETGDISHALELALNAYDLAEEAGFNEEKNDAARALGTIYSRFQKFDEAEEHLKHAIKIATENHDRYRYGQSLLELGKLFQQRAYSQIHDRAKWWHLANKNLTEAVDLFRELGAIKDLEHARSLLSLIIQSISPGGTKQSDSHLRERYPGESEFSVGATYQASVLYIKFNMLIGSEDESVFEMISYYVSSLIQIVKEKEGHIIRGRDHAIVIYGAIINHEDDPERSVETARIMAELTEEKHAENELPVTISYGLTQGIIIGGVTGQPGLEKFVGSGTPIQEAALLAESVPASKIWVTDTVQAATAARYKYSTVSPDDLDFPTSIFQLDGFINGQ